MPQVQETLAATTTSRRANSALRAQRRFRPMASLLEESAAMTVSVRGRRGKNSKFEIRSQDGWRERTSVGR